MVPIAEYCDHFKDRVLDIADPAASWPAAAATALLTIGLECTESKRGAKRPEVEECIVRIESLEMHKEEFEVCFSTLTGQTHVLPVSPDNTVAELKVKLAARDNSLNNINLIYVKKLENHETVASSGMYEGAKVNVVLNVKSVPSQPPPPASRVALAPPPPPTSSAVPNTTYGFSPVSGMPLTNGSEPPQSGVFANQA